MADGLIERLRADLLKTGYPLELETSAALEKRGWIVTNNPVYLDPDETKLREFDLSALKIRVVHPKDAAPGQVIVGDAHGLSAVLTIECKKSADRPWVFFTKPAGTTTHMRYHYVSKIKSLVTFGDTSATVFPIAFLSTCFWHFHQPSRSRSFVEGFKTQDSQPSQIWSALNQVVNATGYQKGQYQLPILKRMTSWFCPIIVFDGNLFEAQLHSDDIQLTPSNHVIVEFDRISKDDPSNRREYLVDVVTKGHLEDFLDEVDGPSIRQSRRQTDGTIR